MGTRDSLRATEGLIVQQATAVAADAVRAALITALRAAEVCGCRHCRVQAVQTVNWAAGVLEPFTRSLDDDARLPG